MTDYDLSNLKAFKLAFILGAIQIIVVGPAIPIVLVILIPLMIWITAAIIILSLHFEIPVVSWNST